MVVYVYTVNGANGSTAYDLDQFEKGHYGKYFY